MSFLMLIVGFLFLIKGADLFVEGASSVARKFNVPAMVIGLTVVAMGTSAPEASVSITSSLAGQNDMSVANIVGSNFFNILMVLGISSLIATLPVEKNTVKKDIPFLILVSFMMLFFAIDLNITRFEGILLLVVFSYFIISTIKNAKKNEHDMPHLEIETALDSDTIVLQEISFGKTIALCIVGIVGIVLGGDIVVKSASSIASVFGMSDNLIGLTIVAVGTSLPEFVTSIMAVKKGETEIAIGNVVGSNLFNILFILGLACTISPIQISMLAVIDVMFMVFITILLYVFIKKENLFVKKHGITFVILYIIYLTYTIIR
ncbi:MAG: calcium/sodium antiporter [Peptostreptococcaceae bacterium]